MIKFLRTLFISHPVQELEIKSNADKNISDVPTDPITPSEFIKQAKNLFYEYREDFGLSNVDFPEAKPQDRALEFEEKFLQLICMMDGHAIGPDVCGKYEHDLCYYCNNVRADLKGYIQSDWRISGSLPNN